MKGRLSRLLSYVLRHRPDEFGLELDKGGWVSVEALLAAVQKSSHETTLDDVKEVVRRSDKQRFALSADGLRIRANQGHSVDVDLALDPVEPPELLFHGTVQKALPSIREEGLLRGRRHHVHLSPDRATASAVGARRGRPIILTVKAAEMHAEGHEFYRSLNDVWLTYAVPPGFILFDWRGFSSARGLDEAQVRAKCS